MFINEDLIESIEATPDTVLTLVDGRKIVVADPPQMVIDRARVYRASVLAATDELRSGGQGGEVLQFPVAGPAANAGASSGANSEAKAKTKAGSRPSGRRPGGDR
jgi:flagellar protein FlbD